MKEEKIQKQNVGNAGEYYIAARLSEKDFTVTITLGRAEKYDILALSPKGKFIKISVKTSQVDNVKSFILSSKDEIGESKDFYYAFVKLNSFKSEPDFWIIPSKIVCPLLKDSHKRWKERPNNKGGEHGFSTMRKMPIEITKGEKQYYSEGWDKEVKKYYKNLKQLE